MMTTVQMLSALAPWQPAPTAIPAGWQRFMRDLVSQAAGTPHEYVLDTPYDANSVGNLLRTWGLPLPVVLAGYLMEYDSKLIQSSGLPESDEIIHHIQEASRYAHDIEDEHLHPLLNPPYRDLGALLLAVVTYYQALKRLQKQNNGKPLSGNMLIHIESVGRTLLNISKRLGMWHFKRQVEDITEQLRDPVMFAEDQKEYLDILHKDDSKLEHVRQLLIQGYQQVTRHPVTIIYYPCSVAGYKRRQQDAQTVTSQKVQLTGFDLVTFVVIVPMVKDCYTAFGIFSQLGIIQDKVSDQIANPKPNGNSLIAFGLMLNTANGSEKSRICQLQIATRIMQAIAYFGCLYPDYRSYLERSHNPKKDQSLPAKHYWNSEEGKVFQIAQNEITADAYPAERYATIIVYDKSRKPFALPVNATAIDFAYVLGKDVGDLAVEAFVNNRKAPLYRPLEAGDIVEIRTARQSQATDAWLDYAKTPGAKQDIKEAVRRRTTEHKGYELLQQELRKYHHELTPRELDEELRLLLKRRHLGTQQAFLAGLGDGGKGSYTPNWAAQEIMKQIGEHNQVMAQGSDRSIWVPVIEGHMSKKITYRTQRNCGLCRPSYPRDEKIMGRLRRRSGELIVHNETCSHLIDRPLGRHSMLVPMTWQPQAPALRVAFRVMVQDRRGLIFDLTRQLRHHNCDLLAINAEAINPKTGIGHMNFTVEAHSENEVMDVWEDVYNIDNIVEVMIDPIGTPAPVYEHLNALYQNRDKLAAKTLIEFTWEEAVNTLPRRGQTLLSPFDISRPPVPMMFFGRSEETRFMRRELCDGEQGRALVLYGPRRSGKSSICHNFLGSQVHPPYWGVLFSLQNAIGETEAMILRDLSDRVSSAFSERLQQRAPVWDDFQDSDPQKRFKRVLQASLKQVPGSRLVLALDEFGGAIDAFDAGTLEFRFFTYWKELMAEVPRLSLIIALPTSSHYRLCAEQFAHAFSFAQTLPMSFLDTESAKRLLADPLHELHIAIHPNTVALAVTLTGGSPYYLTLIGQQLIEQLNRDVRRQVVSDKALKAVIDHFIEKDAIQNFNFLRTELQNKEEFVILETMIDSMHYSNQVEMQLAKIASLAHMRVPHARRHLDRLRSGLILEEHGPPTNPFYSFKIDLVRRWLSRNRSFFTV